MLTPPQNSKHRRRGKMTTKPTRTYVAHSGFNDLLSFVASTPSRMRALSTAPKPLQPTSSDLIAVRYEEMTATPNADPDAPPTPPKDPGYAKRREVLVDEHHEGRAAAQEVLRKRKVDKKDIGPPLDFR